MAKNKEKYRYKKWWKYLLGFLVWLIIACVLFFGAIMLDSAMPDGSGPEMSGHRAPVFMLLSIPFLAAVTLVLFLRLVAKIIKSVKYYRILKEQEEAEQAALRQKARESGSQYILNREEYIVKQ